MKAIKVSITRFVDEWFPGYVECTFNDARGREHIVHEKVPIFTDLDLDINSEYPQNGVIACEIINQSVDPDGRIIFSITTAKPWLVNTVDGQTEFEVSKEQIIELAG
jgi:hypothetical protein